MTNLTFTPAGQDALTTTPAGAAALGLAPAVADPLAGVAADEEAFGYTLFCDELLACDEDLACSDTGLELALSDALTLAPA